MRGNERVRHCERCKKDVVTVTSLSEMTPGTCVRILVAAVAIAGCSSANLEAPPTRTVVMPPAEAGAPSVDIVGFLEEEVDLPPARETKR